MQQVVLGLLWVCTLCVSFSSVHKQFKMASRVERPLFSTALGAKQGQAGYSLTSPRIQRLKDANAHKEIIRTITAAEFAMVVQTPTGSKRGGASSIDYQMLIDKLDANAEELRRKIRSQGGEIMVVQGQDSEKGSAALLQRVIRTRDELHEYIQVVNTSENGPSALQNTQNTPAEAAPIIQTSTGSSSSSISSSSNIEIELNIEQTMTKEQAEKEKLILQEVQDIRNQLRVVVREDGTVDWDGALSTGKQAAKLGTELWIRLNGKEEEDALPSLQEIFGQVTAKITKEDASPGVASRKAAVALQEEEVAKAEEKSEVLRSQLRLQRDTYKGSSPSTSTSTSTSNSDEGGALDSDLQLIKKDSTSTSDSAGSTDTRTSKGNVISGGVSASDISRLVELDSIAKESETRLKLLVLDLDLERICLFIEQELETSIDPADQSSQRLLVAEATLLDKQLRALCVCSDEALLAASALDQENFPSGSSGPSSLTMSSARCSISTSTLLPLADISQIDSDELTLVSNKVLDLKTRLGLLSSGNRGKEVDWGSLGEFAQETGNKVKLGFNFYQDGTRLLVNDLQYAWGLVIKATTGRTLKPVEVNTVRRTGKDLLTLIPFTVILIIPLTPIGHVLVFSFIQRYFPEFYPSCYTEKRLNLKKLYAEIERKDIDDYGDILDPPTPILLNGGTSAGGYGNGNRNKNKKRIVGVGGHQSGSDTEGDTKKGKSSSSQIFDKIFFALQGTTSAVVPQLKKIIDSNSSSETDSESGSKSGTGTD